MPGDNCTSIKRVRLLPVSKPAPHPLPAAQRAQIAAASTDTVAYPSAIDTILPTGESMALYNSKVNAVARKGRPDFEKKRAIFQILDTAEVKDLKGYFFRKKEWLNPNVIQGKSKLRLWEACNEVHFNLVENAGDSIYDAASRPNPRTRDEILIDCANPRTLGMGTQHKQEKKSMGVKITFGNFREDSRVHHIKDKKVKKQFIELADEYDRLSIILSGIKMQLAGITGAYPFELTNVDDEPFEFFGIESR